MGEEGIAQRIIARHLHTNSIAFLRRDNEFLERDTRRFADRCNAPLFFEDRPGLTFQALKSMAGEYVARHGIKMICVDYFQLVGGRLPRQSQAEHFDVVAQWMADFAKATGTAMVVPSQINREGEARGGDGFRLACDMFLCQHKVLQPDGRTEGVWLEMMDSRYTATTDIGSEDCAAFFIHKHGPHLSEL
jgi:replicative DNA helicase